LGTKKDQKMLRNKGLQKKKLRGKLAGEVKKEEGFILPERGQEVRLFFW